MTTQNLALFKALGAKMDFLNQRQRIVSQNIANSDTPGYKPKDLVEVDFSRVLKDVSQTGRKNVHLVTTDALHMPPPSDIPDPKSKKQKVTYEVAPAGNSVILEEQVMKAGRNMMDYNLMTNLYQKHVRMIQTALGTGR